LTEAPEMSPHEQALFDIVRILAKTMVENSADNTALRTKLTTARHTAFASGHTSVVEMFDRLIDELFPPPPSKRPFHVV